MILAKVAMVSPACVYVRTYVQYAPRNVPYPSKKLATVQSLPLSFSPYMCIALFDNPIYGEAPGYAQDGISNPVYKQLPDRQDSSGTAFPTYEDVPTVRPNMPLQSVIQLPFMCHCR